MSAALQSVEDIASALDELTATKLTNFEGRHTSDSAEWYTPSTVVEAARTVMGAIDLDPASHEEANKIVKAKFFYTEVENGLNHPWEGRLFINPPGGKVKEFWRKLMNCAVTPDLEAIWIGYSLEQFQTLQGMAATPLNFPLCITSRRIAFVENEAKKEQRRLKALRNGKKFNPRSSPSHGNYITYIGDNKEAFYDVFSEFGQVIIR